MPHSKIATILDFSVLLRQYSKPLIKIPSLRRLLDSYEGFRFIDWNSFHETERLLYDHVNVEGYQWALCFSYLKMPFQDIEAIFEFNMTTEIKKGGQMDSFIWENTLGYWQILSKHSYSESEIEIIYLPKVCSISQTMLTFFSCAARPKGFINLCVLQRHVQAPPPVQLIINRIIAS